MVDTPRTPSPTHAGFTLVELLVVLAIVATLLMLALPRYTQSTDVARDRILVENLRITRDAIDKFHADRRRYPDSLEELVERKYLRELPMDPVTGRNDTWQIEAPPPEFEGQVANVRSNAPGQHVDGKPYTEL